MTTLNLSYPARIILGLLLSICGGLAFMLAFPPYEIWPLVLVGYIPVLVAQHRIMPPKLSSLATAVAIAVWLQGYLGLHRVPPLPAIMADSASQYFWDYRHRDAGNDR